MGIQVNLRFKGLNLTYDGRLREKQLIDLAKTLKTWGEARSERYPLGDLIILLEQVVALVPELGANDKLRALREWLGRSPQPDSQELSLSPAKPHDVRSSQSADALVISREEPDASWLPDLVNTLIQGAIRPALAQSKTLTDYDRNELLDGLPDEVDGEVFRIRVQVGSDRPADPNDFDAAATVDDAVADFVKQRAAAVGQISFSPQPLPIPDHFRGDRLGDVWRVPYQDRAIEAKQWAVQHHIPPAAADETRTVLLLIDVQNTFCLPDFELFVAGRSGSGAVDDNRRLCEFIYRNLSGITDIIPTLDTHGAAQIFHPAFWVDGAGRSPDPMTIITAADVEMGQWRVNPNLVDRRRDSLLGAMAAAPTDLQAWALYYVQQLEQAGKYPLTVWPFHSMLGGIGHALVSAVEEAVFFHSMARCSPTQYELKGDNPLTENYSALRPEVGESAEGQIIAASNEALIRQLLTYERIIIAGQAKSHCVAWTVADLWDEIQRVDPAIAQRVYLLEDCMSPVVVPGVVDFSEAGDRAFEGFAAVGMHRVRSVDAFDWWF